MVSKGSWTGEGVIQGRLGWLIVVPDWTWTEPWICDVLARALGDSQRRMNFARFEFPFWKILFFTIFCFILFS